MFPKHLKISQCIQYMQYTDIFFNMTLGRRLHKPFGGIFRSSSLPLLSLRMTDVSCSFCWFLFFLPEQFLVFLFLLSLFLSKHFGHSMLSYDPSCDPSMCTRQALTLCYIKQHMFNYVDFSFSTAGRNTELSPHTSSAIWISEKSLERGYIRFSRFTYIWPWTH